MAISVDARSAPKSEAAARRSFRSSWPLTLLVFLAIALPSNEGYVHAINGQANKLVPVATLGVWGLVLLLERRWPKMHILSWICVALLLMVILSTAFNPDDPIRMQLFIRWVPFLVVTIAFIDIMATRVQPITAIYAMGAGAVVAGFGALFSFLVLGSPRASGPLEDPNDLAYVLTAALPCLLVGFTSSRHRWVRIFGIAGAGICVLGAGATMSRGGFLAMTVVFIWGCLRRLVKVRHVVVGAVAVAVLGGVVLTVASDAIGHALQQKTYIAQGNVNQREMRWAAALRGLSERPVFGQGPGGASMNYVKNSNLAEIYEMTPATHNMYVETASELGLIAFTFFMCLIVGSIVLTKDYYRPHRAAALAAQGSMLAIAVSSTFLSEEYYMPLWATIAVVGALELRRLNKETR